MSWLVVTPYQRKYSPDRTSTCLHPILTSFSFFNFLHNFLNTLKVFYFSFKKWTQVNLKKLSTHTNTYLLPAILSTYIGPMRSICNSSRTLVVVAYCNRLCDSFTYLPIWHDPHTLGSFLLTGKLHIQHLYLQS